MSFQPGEKHHKAKLTVRHVIALRRLHHDAGIPVTSAAKLLNVPYGTALDAVMFRTWRSVADAASDVDVDALIGALVGHNGA